MTLIKHHFIYENNKVDVYFFEDRYRYTVTTDKGIEYRELVDNPDTPILVTINDDLILESYIVNDMYRFPYQAPQMTNKCVRCSNRLGSPRKQYNLANMCERCYKAMSENADTSNTAGMVWYTINEDGSKGPVIKEENNESGKKNS